LAQIVELKEQLGFSVLFITHDMSLLLELCDRIAVMYAGWIMELGSSADLLNSAAHPYTQGLLRSYPSLRGARRELAGIPGSPPDLRDPAPGCPFIPRCGFAQPSCAQVDMSLNPVRGGLNPLHVTACPVVTAHLTANEAPERITAPERALS
jgi:peptide/nickel transport system ATP-binding protein